MDFEDYCIPLKVFKKLPKGARIVRVENTWDMDNQVREALLVHWSEYVNGRYCCLRKAWFCINTGEYLGDMP